MIINKGFKMIVTGTKMFIPSDPFGLPYGFSTLRLGDEVVSNWPFAFGNGRLPAGTRLSILEKREDFYRYELSLPDEVATI